jgi:hypothetical protein
MRRYTVGLVLYTALLGCLSCSDTREESHLERALRFRAAGDLDNARVAIRAAIRDSPADAGLRRSEGLIHLDAGDAAAAEPAFRHALELGLEPDDEFNLAFARSLFLQKKYNDTLDALNAMSFSTNAAELPATILRAESLDQTGDEARAKREFLEILKQLDRRSFRHGDAVDAEAIADAMRRDSERYRSLKAAFAYRDWLRDLPVGTWVTLHEQKADDEVFFGRQNTYGAVAYDAQRDQVVVASHPAHEEPGKFTYLLQKIWPKIGRHPTWLFDLESDRWQPLEAPAESFFQNAIAYDSDHGVIVGYKKEGVFELSGSPRAWHRVLDEGLLGPDNNIEYNSTHRAFVVFGGVPLSNAIAVYEPATKRHRLMPTPGLRPPKHRYAPMAFHSARQDGDPDRTGESRAKTSRDRGSPRPGCTISGPIAGSKSRAPHSTTGSIATTTSSTTPSTTSCCSSRIRTDRSA